MTTAKSTQMIQENKLGSNGTQISTQVNNYGLDYINTKALCLDLIQSELSIYRKEAEAVAIERDNALLNRFFEQLHNEQLNDSMVCEEFKNPDMQYTYIEAQKSYIRLGTDELQNILCDLLVSRVKETNRSLLQIALSEAITVVPMLLPEHLNLLSLCFLLRHTQYTVGTLHSFAKYINNTILPHVSSVIPKESHFQHMVYAKTGTISISSISLEDLLSRSYGGLFLNGYNRSELEEYLTKYPSYFIPCLHNNSKYQINALNLEDLNKRIEFDTILNDNDKAFIRNHFTNNIMSLQEIKTYIISNIPNSNKLFNIWNNTPLKHYTLTSVGILLGANNSKQLTGEKYDMNIWI